MRAVAELVFLHGAADSSAVWELQDEHFAGAHQLLALDLPGHGRRLSEQALASIDLNADQVVREIRAHGFRSPVLVGHSMGGAVALTIALAHPDLVRALVLVASGARLRIPAGLIEAARQRAATAPPMKVVERVIPLDDVVSAHASHEAPAWLGQRFGQSTGQATYADFVATDRFDVMDRLHAIPHPTLIVGGEDDRWTPPKFQHYLAEHLLPSRLVMFQNTGHYPFVEQAAAFNNELERFLSELE